MINIIKNIKARKSHDDKDAYEEFSRVYLDSVKKESDTFKKTYFFNSKYFTRKNFRIVVLEQCGSSNTIQYDSHSNNSKEISSPANHFGIFFNPNINKDLFDMIFGLSSILQTESSHKSKIHILKQENQIVFTLIYPNYSQILKKIRSLSHSPSLSRSSSLGDYASLNNMPLNDLGNNQKRVAICVSWFCNLDDESHMKLMFRYIVHFFQLVTCLSEKIAQIHQDNGTFVADKMVKARHGFVDSLRSLFTSPRLILPVWLSFSLMAQYNWFKEAHNLPAMKRAFFDRCANHLLNKYHTKEKCFFLARAVTAVLMYHQSWIHNISTPVYRRHLRNFSELDKESKGTMSHNGSNLFNLSPFNIVINCQPGICRMSDSRNNAICGQLGSILLGAGGLSLSRTIIVGSNQAQVNLLLYFISYWLHCSLVSVRHEDSPDLNNLYDSKKSTTRRKAASCNDPSDNCVASQEDIRRLLNTREESRGSNSSSINIVGIRNNSVGMVHYKSSASTGSSPVRDYGELQPKHMTLDQMIAVDLAAAEFVHSRQLQMKPSESRKARIDKDGSGSPSDPKIFINEIPFLHGGNVKIEDDILYKSIGHFNICGYVDHVVPGIALQGTSDLTIPNAGFFEDMRNGMKHAFWMFPTQRNTELDWNSETFNESLTDRPCSATSVILNSDKSSTTICTVSTDNRPGDAQSRDLLSSSHMILSLFDQLQALLAARIDPDLVIQLIETRLVLIYHLSVCLAVCIRDFRSLKDPVFETPPINKVMLAEIIGCHSDDIPLLYSTALAHSPDIYGLEDILLY